MTNEYDWIDDCDECKRDFGSEDVLVGWAIYAALVVFLIV